ncbi:MAG: non-canonical purine NTP pyrophosphatase [Planctomycetota bacterium]|jgi:XTP/dITP diphosphohydrolase|nr:non-canonical purine NTP pyrophosphatase [Planctomycetota bacterium]MDP6368564.1 non-canonical purine NTP pyrophosphatase [Planctomycetota bacterium]MDP6520916.1 non-canonical purine NTP pyrophosphatase [Planctomycetota bacterium]MDP6838449.1 non-canonical purine NTP pyrophosphatase [Planctomycetota bacterium]MDP6955794.1 non-canonical purine NTP pyrophosphatase [Planctomycetota bacterium]
MELLIASHNAKKQVELRAMLASSDVTLLTPEVFVDLPEVVEDRDTFRGNAEKKAMETALATSKWCLADDSGLEVDALGGTPGVHSARFAGEHGDDAANNALLLEKLSNLPEAERGARFVCALALAAPDGSLAATFEGSARGRILHAPRGSGDFGYDPLFLFTEEGFAASGRGFAELSADEKSTVSHRGRALRQFVAALPTLLP